MFFLLLREDDLALHPKYFGMDLHSTILQQLRKKVEGKCSGRYGFTVCVIGLENIGPGQLQIDTGYAHFRIQFHALVFRPFKNEILIAEVTSINGNGFFCQAGPLEIFVSNLLMPSTFKFESPDGLPCYVSEDGDQKIKQGSDVRIKLVGVKFSAEEICVIGTMKEDYLGLWE